MTGVWTAAALAVLVGLCWVPFALAAHLALLSRAWAEALGRPGLRVRVLYGLARARSVGAALLLGALGLGYLFLIGRHIGVLR